MRADVIERIQLAHLSHRLEAAIGLATARGSSWVERLETCKRDVDSLLRTPRFSSTAFRLAEGHARVVLELWSRGLAHEAAPAGRASEH